MKWIGQNIYDLISRFRSDVYLEDISSGTIASGGNLGLDSNNKIVKQADTGITDLHGAGVDGSNNQLLTDSGDGTVSSERYLTFLNSGNSSRMELLSNEDMADKFQLTTTTHGETTLLTIDGGSNAANLNFSVDGLINSYTASGQYRWFRGANTADYLQLDIDANGGAKFTTLDAAATAANFEIESDGAITLDTAAQIDLKLNDGEYINMYNGENLFAYFYTESGASSSLLMFENGGDDINTYFQLIVTEHGETTLSTEDNDGTQAHIEIDADGDIILDAAGQIKLEPGTSVLWDSLALTGIQASSESFADNDVSLMTSAAIDDKINTKYSTSYFTFSAKSTSSFGTNYIAAPANGIMNVIYNQNSGVDSAGDFGGVTTEQGGSGTDATMSVPSGNMDQQIPIAEACKLLGFYATTTTTTSAAAGYDTGVAMWHVPESGVQWGSSVASTATLIHKSDSSRHAENTAHGGSSRKKVQLVKRMDGTAKDLAAGDILCPTIFGETSNQNVVATVTLVFATPIKTF